MLLVWRLSLLLLSIITLLSSLSSPDTAMVLTAAGTANSCSAALTASSCLLAPSSVLITSILASLGLERTEMSLLESDLLLDLTTGDEEDCLDSDGGDDDPGAGDDPGGEVELLGSGLGHRSGRAW